MKCEDRSLNYLDHFTRWSLRHSPRVNQGNCDTGNIYSTLAEGLRTNPSKIVTVKETTIKETTLTRVIFVARFFYALDVKDYAINISE